MRTQVQVRLSPDVLEVLDQTAGNGRRSDVVEALLRHHRANVVSSLEVLYSAGWTPARVAGACVQLVNTPPHAVRAVLGGGMTSREADALYHIAQAYWMPDQWLRTLLPASSATESKA